MLVQRKKVHYNSKMLLLLGEKMKLMRDAVVLVVDDKEENLAIMVAALGDDYEVSVATDGNSALEAVAEIHPDIILLDVIMPDIDGYEVCRRLKDNESTMAIPVIFLTALTDSEAKTRGFALGAVDYITKPFEISEVRARVHTHLAIYFMGQELEQQKEIALENARLKAEFLATMSHEIRTPLNGILGMIQLLLETSLTQKQRGFAQTVYDSSNSLLSIINDILDHSKLEAGKLELEKIPFSPHKLLESVRSLMINRADEKGLHLYVNIDDAVPEAALGDPNRIRQILLNFVNNAIKFTDKGFVRINLLTDIENYLYFSVADTGIGISGEDRKKLFKDFSQVDSSISRRYGGTGLGLSICNKIVALMNGKIGVKSELGKGSEFWIIVPAEFTEQAEVAEGGTTVIESPLRTLPKLRILIAEDNKVNQEVLKGILDDTYHEISIANNGVESVQACGEHVYDIILMDMHMPDMNGITAAQRIRSLPGVTAGVPIIAVTASVGAADKDECLAAGMNGYITKPIDQNTLIAEIARLTKTSMLNSVRTVAVRPEIKYLDPELLGNLENSVGRECTIMIFKEFIKNIGSFKSAIKTAFLSYDSRQLFFQVHKLKGAGVNLAMYVLGEIIEKIESLLKSEEWLSIRGMIAELDIVIENTLHEAEIIYPELYDIATDESMPEICDERLLAEFADLINILKDALQEESLERYEDIANHLFTLDIPESCLKQLRRIDVLAFSENFSDACLLLAELQKKLERYKADKCQDSIKSILIMLKSAVVSSKPKEISYAVDILKRMSMPEAIQERVDSAIAKLDSYKYKESAAVLSECIRDIGD